MKKAIKKTCVVLLLFALLVSQVAASYSETGTLNEGTSARWRMDCCKCRNKV